MENGDLSMHASKCYFTLTPICRKALLFFRGSEYTDLDQELKDISETKEKKQMNQNSDAQQIIKRIFSPEFFKPFSCVGFCSILMGLSGYVVINSYTATFLKKSGTCNSPICLCVLGTFGSIVSGNKFDESQKLAIL
jgi:hypothetical protein